MSQLRNGAAAPANPFPLLPLRTGVLFPGVAIALPVGRDRSVALLRAVEKGAVIGVVAQRDGSVSDPKEDDLHRVGTFARITRLDRGSDGVYRVVLEGLGRFALRALSSVDPFWRAEGDAIIETGNDDPEAVMLADALRKHVEEISGEDKSIATHDEPGLVADKVAAGLDLAPEKAVEVLGIGNVVERLRRVTAALAEAKAMAELRKKIESDVRRELNEKQKEALLREQLKAIKREIGEDDAGGETDALEKKLAQADLPEEIRAAADRELKRLKASNGQGPEANVIRNYLELIAELPWNKRAETKAALDAVAEKLEADHYGLDDVKKRILEHMAVLELAANRRGTILCFAGPPGVGKTSLGQSIADATGRPFIRISLGGVRDEAEIRGHRRTYVGALPGRIIHALRKVKAKNPVILLDEVDKLSQGGWSGSPEAALLEVLDPEQNKTFTDHYLELPFDLSEVFFIATVNDLGALSAPLRDRLEVIELSGYTFDEKAHIARRHLLPKQLKDAGVPAEGLALDDEALRAIVRDYTREPGVRQLTREITRVVRQVALEVAKGRDVKANPVHIDEAAVRKYLGKAKFTSDVAERTAVAGVATGLAWTPVGGDILFIETSRMPGRGQIEITGQLGDVMKESARAALTYVRSNATKFGVDPSFLEKQDVHIHVPAGAVPKDGPSAGVTMFTALTSLLTGRRVRPDTAMTGEATLRGRVLPVGGIKVKVMAAHRAGIQRVILPARNAPDADEIPAEVRNSMEILFADDMSQVIEAALEPKAEVPGSHELAADALLGTTSSDGTAANTVVPSAA
jgi:ATP-dependent Lon protease